MTQTLNSVFTLADARSAGIRKRDVYRMLETGEVERVGRGVFVFGDRLEPSLVALAAASAVRPEATMCLTSALVYHELSDAIPIATDIALPRGVRNPAGIAHVGWHSFALATFEVGREKIPNDDELSLAVYSAERTIVDCFRLAHIEGADVANLALRRWLAKRGNSPASLLKTGASFPKATARLRSALETLL